MRKPITTVLIVVTLSLAAAARAQLGPKETISQPATDIARVKVGQPAPDFTLEDSDSNAITLSDYRGKKTVVLVFYRGYW